MWKSVCAYVDHTGTHVKTLGYVLGYLIYNKIEYIIG